MILIVSRKDDVHADLVVDHLNSIGVSFFRFNTEDACNYGLNIGVGCSEIRNKKSGRVVRSSEIKSVWLRRRSVPLLPQGITTHRSFLESEWTWAFKGLWDSLSKSFWLSNPLSMAASSEKMKQLRVASEIGFMVPETLYTNSSEAIKDFVKRVGKCIYKPHDGSALDRDSNSMIYTNLISPSVFGEKDFSERMSLCPGIFQNYIEKAYELRVTVVGDKVFATKIDSQASSQTKIDWRKYDFNNVRHEEYVLPSNIGNQCVSLVKKLGLHFGAIDIIVAPSGEFWFLEINANGQWAWIEFITKQPISRSIADLLVSPNG